MRLNLIFYIFLIFTSIASAQTYFKGPALVETPTSVATSSGTTTLTKDSNTVQNFTGTLDHTVALPDATTIPVGRYFEIWNKSTQAIDVVDTGLTLVREIPPGLRVKFVSTSTGSANGAWLFEELKASQVGNTPAGNISATTVQGAINELDTDLDTVTGDLADTTKYLLQATSTGVKAGMNLSVNVGDNTEFDIAAGKYEIIDLSNIDSPSICRVDYPGSTANTVTNLATHDVTFISINCAGTIIQSTTYPTPVDRRDYAFIGRLNHSNRTSVQFADTFPDFKLSISSSFYDLVDAIAPFRLSDFTITANGANLSFDRQDGSVFFRADNYTANYKNPHIKSYNSQTLQPFRKMTRSAFVDPSSVTVLDPANYDNAGTVTAVGGATSRSTIQRVYLYKSGAVGVQYGQNIYSTFPDALEAVTSDSFVVNPTVEQTAVLIAMVVLRRNCTSLLDTTCAKIIPVNRFGGLGGGAGGGAGDFQGVYDNSTSPQLTLNSTQGSLLFRDASTPIGTTLFAVQNNAGTSSYLGVDTNGLSTTNFTGTGTTGAVRLHNLTTTQRNALTPAAGMIVYDTTLNQMQGYANGDWGELTREKQSSSLALVDGAELAISLTHSRQTWLIKGNSGPVTLSATPFGSAEPLNGAEITLIGRLAGYEVTIPVNNGLFGVQGYQVTLGEGQVVTYKYNSVLGRYLIKSFSN